MREHVLEIPCDKGIRSDFRAGRNQQAFVTLKNVEIHSSGLSTYTPIVNPIPADVIAAGGLFADFPFPQLFKGKKYTYLFTRSALYLIDERDWTIYYVTTYDYANQSTEKAITNGGLWQLADFEDSWFATNGRSLVFQVGGTEKVYVSDVVSMEAVCEYRGRLIYGGFDTDVFWSSAWETFWDTWSGETDVGLTVSTPIGNNQIWWSIVGGGNSTWLHDTPDVTMLQNFERGDTGFATMEWGGLVRCLKPLGPYLMVYGDGGVTALKTIVEPAPAMAMTTLLKTLGICNTGAVGGDLKSHVFVDSNGAVWIVGEDLQLKRLGYEEYMRPMLGTNILVNHSEKENVFYIGNDKQTFILTQAGMTETDQFITSTYYTQGETVGFSSDHNNEESEGLIVTDIIDMGYRAFKSIHAIECAMISVRPVYVAVEYRNKTSDSFSSTDWFELNDEGWAVVTISALEFRIKIKWTPYYDAEPPDYISVRWNATDNRNRRSQ